MGLILVLIIAAAVLGGSAYYANNQSLLFRPIIPVPVVETASTTPVGSSTTATQQTVTTKTVTTKTVTPTPIPPIKVSTSFTAFTNGTAPLTARFEMSDRVQPGTRIDFGDGSVIDVNTYAIVECAEGSTCPTAFELHTYRSAGTYTARLYMPIHDCGTVGTLCAEETLGTATVTVK